jgi:hypothetical protein
MADLERFADWVNEIAANPARRARWGLVLVFVGLAVLAVWHQRIYNTLAGPAPLDTAAAVAFDGVPFRQLVTLEDHGKPVPYAALGEAIAPRRGADGESSRGASPVAGMRIVPGPGRTAMRAGVFLAGDRRRERAPWLSPPSARPRARGGCCSPPRPSCWSSTRWPTTSSPTTRTSRSSTRATSPSTAS